MKSGKEDFESANEAAQRGFKVVCSWCGAIIRSDPSQAAERMCLICHARLLNDYFQRVRKRGANRAAGG
jgi:hypothetical protein